MLWENQRCFFAFLYLIFLYIEKVICNEKRKLKMFLNVKKVTNCKQLKGEKMKRWKGEK